MLAFTHGADLGRSRSYLLDRAGGLVPWLKWAVVVVGLGSPSRLALDAPAAGGQARPPPGGPRPGGPLAGPAAYAVSRPDTGAPSLRDRRARTPRRRLDAGDPPGPAATGRRPAARAAACSNGSTPTARVTALLRSGDAGAYTWVAAAVGSNNAAGYQLATEEPVMAIGGFNGSDPSPTLAQFETYVANGEIHYFIAGGGMGGGLGGRAPAAPRRSPRGSRATFTPPRSTA